MSQCRTICFLAGDFEDFLFIFRWRFLGWVKTHLEFLVYCGGERMNLKLKMNDNKRKSIFSFLKVNLLSAMLLILFNNTLYCQEFKDSLPLLNILKTSHFKKVHRDTIYKVERIVYISKDTCPEKHFEDMHSIFNNCPASEAVILKYVRDKRVWTSINADKIIEKGKFRKSKMSFWDDLVRPRRRLPKIVEKKGEWISFSPAKNEGLNENGSCSMVAKLNNSLYQKAWFNVGKTDGDFRASKKACKNGKRVQFYSQFILKEKNLELHAYYQREVHRTYYYFIVENLPDKTNYYFLKGLFLDDILKDLKRKMRNSNIIERQKIACGLIDFYYQYDEYKWNSFETITIEKK